MHKRTISEKKDLNVSDYTLKKFEIKSHKRSVSVEGPSRQKRRTFSSIFNSKSIQKPNNTINHKKAPSCAQYTDFITANCINNKIKRYKDTASTGMFSLNSHHKSFANDYYENDDTLGAHNFVSSHSICIEKANTIK